MSRDDENINRINHIREYIDENYVQKLVLSELAEKACFSPFHFQRVFKSIVGETPKQYIKRLRLEATAQYIFLKPYVSILEVGLIHGFSSLEDFSRAFKGYYSVSPDTFRNSTEAQKIKLLNKKTGHQLLEGINMLEFRNIINNSDVSLIEIEVKKLSYKKLIYKYFTLKNFGFIMNKFQDLQSWGKARDLINPDPEIFGMMFDFPAFTSHDNNRFCTCITVTNKPEISGDVNYMELPSRTYASLKVKPGSNEYMKSISLFIAKWLPLSGYEICQLPILLYPLEDPLINNIQDIPYQLYIPISPK